MAVPICVADYTSKHAYAKVFEAQHILEYGFKLENRSLLVDDIRVRVQLSRYVSKKKIVEDAYQFVNFCSLLSLQRAEQDFSVPEVDLSKALVKDHSAYFSSTGLVACPVFDTATIRDVRVL